MPTLSLMVSIFFEIIFHNRICSVSVVCEQILYANFDNGTILASALGEIGMQLLIVIIRVSCMCFDNQDLVLHFVMLMPLEFRTN